MAQSKVKPTRIIDSEEARAILKKKAAAFDKEIDFELDEYSDDGESEHWTVHLYEGQVKTAGNFAVTSETVLVVGDLAIDGTLSDCGNVDHTLLVVIGNLSVKNAFLAGEVVVTGNFSCDELIYADSSNDYSLLVGGNVRAKALVEGGMCCEVRGAIDAPAVLSYSNEITAGEKKIARTKGDAARKVFRPEFLDEHVQPDDDKIREALMGGKSVLL